MKILIICNKSCVEKKYNKMSDIFYLQLNRLRAEYTAKMHDVALVFIDVEKEMKKFGLSPVTDGMDQKQVKDAVDGLAKGYHPGCIVIVGAQDVIPFQLLKDEANGSRESFIDSDLPYASSEPYSDMIGKFLTPSRAVTRIPDVYGNTAGRQMDIFIRSIDSCLGLEPCSIHNYQDIFSISTKTWEDLTDKILNNLSVALNVHKHVSPTEGPPWDKKLFSWPLHYLNLHGGRLKAKLIGEDKNGQCDAIYSKELEGSLAAGTIAVLLSCFGGQLYSNSMELPFSNTYLANGAALMASTVIAYTNKSEEYSAIFLNHILKSKKSMPEALLQTRLDYVKSHTQLNVIEQKTIAEFVVYGGYVESVVSMGDTEENTEEAREKELKKRIEEIKETCGMAMYNPELPIPEVIRQRLKEAEQDGFVDISAAKGFDIVPIDLSKKNSEFEKIKQYSAEMTDDHGCKHVVVYTMTADDITSVEDYMEK